MIRIKPSERNTNKHTEQGMELDCRYADVIVKRMLNLDSSLTVKRNGVDCKAEFLA